MRRGRPELLSDGGKEMSAADLSAGLTNIVTVVNTATGIIQDNALLMAVFCGGILMVGFRIFRAAARTVRG